MTAGHKTYRAFCSTKMMAIRTAQEKAESAPMTTIDAPRDKRASRRGFGVISALGKTDIAIVFRAASHHTPSFITRYHPE
jgi:hypothetical protein